MAPILEPPLAIQASALDVGRPNPISRRTAHFNEPRYVSALACDSWVLLHAHRKKRCIRATPHLAIYLRVLASRYKDFNEFGMRTIMRRIGSGVQCIDHEGEAHDTANDARQRLLMVTLTTTSIVLQATIGPASSTRMA